MTGWPNLLKSKKQQTPSEPVEYPSGTFVRTERGYFFIVGPGKRFYIPTTRILDSWKPHRVAESSESAVRNFKIKGRLKFRNGSLLYSQADAKMYLVSDHKLRHITNPDWLDLLGIDRYEAVWVSREEIKLHELGEPLH